MPAPGRGRGRGRGRGTRAGGGQAHVPGWAADAGPANTGKSAQGASRFEKQRMYRHPLPLLDVPPADAALFARLDARGKKATLWERVAGVLSWLAAGKASGEDLPAPVVGQYDALTRSVWVTDPAGAQVLWRRGFFGKGSLSRSEPTHLARREHMRQVLAERARAEAAGQPVILTAEELTAVRRRERLQAKIERARAAVRAGTQRADGVLSLGGELTEEDIQTLKAAGGILSDDGQKILHIDESLTFAEADLDQEDGTYRTAVPGLIYFRGGEDAQAAVEARARARAQAGLEEAPSILPPKSSTPPPSQRQQAEPTETETESATKTDSKADAKTESKTEASPPPLAVPDANPALEEEEPLEEVEWVQLSMIETFFLSVMLGALEVVNAGKTCSPTEVMDLCLSATASPSILAPHVKDPQGDWWRRADNPFLVNYVAYHHYRSLGWCVKPGTKFCVDFLLYKRGPVFGHAEFAILVIPSYEDDRDREESPFTNSSAGPMDWVRFSSVNRVNTQVLKTLILCHVHVPSIARARSEGQLDSPHALVEAIKEGRSYAVHDTAVRRWVPARMKP